MAIKALLQVLGLKEKQESNFVQYDKNGNASGLGASLKGIGKILATGDNGCLHVTAG